MMRFFHAFTIWFGFAGLTAVQAAEPPLSFNKDIRPILAENCLSCHGPGKKNGDLRLDQADAAKKGGKSGIAAVVAGHPEQSELIRRILTDDASEVMPPPKAKKVLKPEEIAKLKLWVSQGAVFEGHWAFQPIRTVSTPEGQGNPIDGFLLARQKQAGLQFRPQASKEVAIRRVAFTLTGLPPTIAEVDQYLADSAGGAYERMVDRYLGSPRYGEEMARHWLDVARYADTHGLHLDNERQMWAYRDWVIRSFNDNRSFAQFAIDQIAGDLVPGSTLDQKVATGFSRCNVTTGEGGSIDAEWVYRNAVERASTVYTAFLGLTGGCAQCHDHKFDPITAKDFYATYAFFYSAADPPLDGNALLTAPTVKLETPAYQKQREALLKTQKDLTQKLRGLAQKTAYQDPSEDPARATAQRIEDVWFDDAFPPGRVFASPGHATQYVDAGSGRVFSGSKALKRTDTGLAQDVVEGMPAKTIPPQGKLFAHVYVDPANKPKTLMLQYFKGDWLHRAVWGDYDAIPWGAPGTTQKVAIGPIPASGQWLKLEVDAEKLGLKPGDAVTGFALTQHGGTVYWDRVGVAGTNDPAKEPKLSLKAWWLAQKGKDQPGTSGPLATWIKSGPETKLNDEEKKTLREHYVANVWEGVADEVKDLRKKTNETRESLTKLEGDLPGSFIFTDLPQPRQSFVMMRGQYDKPGDKVDPSTPGFLPPLRGIEGRKANRLDLANWLVSAEQPLVPRVVVNRYWQQIFGVGLVKTSGDFGTQGELPSHPELLDWLASHFRASGWNVKELLKLFLTSKAFRQSSEAPEALWALDPENRLLARGPRIRLDAEQIRDNALFTGGLVKLDAGGRGTMPYQPSNIWEPVGFAGSNTRFYQQSKGEDLYRRSIYVFIKRTAPAPFMSNFDAPNRETSCAKRERSNTPLQALQLMNDIQHVEAARGLAARLLKEKGLDASARIRLGFRMVLSRTPTAEEESTIKEFLEKELVRYKADPASAEKLIKVGDSPAPAGLHTADLAAHTMLANLLLNLDETINRN